MHLTPRRESERRRTDRRRSAESVFASIAALLGPRLRHRSALQLRMGLEAVPTGAGAVMVITIPANRNTPVEIQTFPAGVSIGLLEALPTSA